MAFDRSQEYREVVRQKAVDYGLSEEKLKLITASWLLPPKPHTSEFMTTAYDILDNIHTMKAFIRAHQQDYLDPLKLSEPARDSIENEVNLFIKACKARIDSLQSTVAGSKSGDGAVAPDADDRAGGSRGFGLGFLRSGGGNPQRHAHEQGVVLILSERLAYATAVFDQCRTARYEQALAKRVTRPSQPARPARPLEAAWKQASAADRRWVEMGSPRRPVETRGVGRENGAGGGGGEASPRQQQLLQEEEEHSALEEELSGLMDSVREAESKMLEVSALNHMFATTVLQQREQIEQLYNQAVEATQFMEKGNVELKKAVERSGSTRVYIILTFAVAIFGLLFLDWYNS